ncbi:MAG: type II toxin-antitoxin system RelE/ParE family toxin [Candidatus Magnetobacterium sp. LHC-1]|uniref:Type II toxin-antitoxin system RelE/ParE family toxin n=1 Tax=Candidatus Magnetobacterium casense TaxID=1455061 RepID=A0ABS6RVZ6_9BACT|nr:type II toxin-antitoxin system RelE/ParE family toxin [Candidatus Magnetobacterium casensis]MBF0608000.1 type II toxin-antitoxin system RelE/ParE family toxin [Nitrospirota bacterium]MBV6340798.1 type II toxin-antitoxin system RelE/ParE family toxin [Candidatus Magnetobacterium casensis]
MRVFKSKWFNRWARQEDISDAVLYHTAEEIVAGNVEVKLGGSLFKKRLPRTGGGKRSGYRVIVGYKKPNNKRIIFLYAFSKNHKGNISDREEAALNLVVEGFVSAVDDQISELLATNSVWEVQLL